MSRGDPQQPVRPSIAITIDAPDGPVHALIEWRWDDSHHWIATVPGDGPVATRRVWLPMAAEGRTWRRA